ncbi:MAG: hypothetical protein WB992_03610 [Bryobacteraceae bacterium]
MSIHQMIKAAPEVSQLTLERLISMRNAMDRASADFDRISNEVLLQLLNGAQVEPGVHVAKVDVKTKGGKQIRRLKVS